MRLKEFASEYRPREKIKSLGPSALSNNELLALILRTGTKNHNVLELSTMLLTEHSPIELSQMSYNELTSISGVGCTKASQIMALFELCKRFEQYRKPVTKISQPEDIVSIFSPKIRNATQEQVFAVFLDSKNNIIASKLIFIGTVNEAVIHPREIFKEAIKHSSVSIVLIHNHPSGNPEPSKEDIKITEVIEQAGKLINIPIIDHIIIGNPGFFSFKKNNLL